MARIVGPTDPTLTAPPWAGDFMSPQNLVRGPLMLDASQFPTRDRVKVEVGTAGASVDATTVPVEALSGPVPSGTALSFGGDKFALLTAAASLGDTEITVEELVTALVDGDAAYYEPNNDVPIESGIPVGRTLAERNAGTNFGPADQNDDEIFLVAFAIDNATLHPDFEAYKPNKDLTVKEDLLPEWGNTDIWEANLVTALRTRYHFTLSDEG